MSNRYTLQLILGLDIYISELELLIHQPTLDELALTMMSSHDLYQVLGIFTVNGLKQENINNFQSFMLIYSNLKDKKIKNNFNLMLDLLFPNCQINFVADRTIYIEQNIG
ncbi:MAG: hypothetical protein K2M17_05010, partial [Bacilli bacterium]|nr:hypothetical protein [Bacilli bacterium]